MNILIQDKMKATKDELIAKTKDETIKLTIDAIKYRVKEHIENDRSKRDKNLMGKC